LFDTKLIEIYISILSILGELDLSNSQGILCITYDIIIIAV